MLTIQTAGTLVVSGTFVLAEASARFLDACPASDLAWHLNLVVFRAFERARIDASLLNGAFGPALLPVALMLMMVAVGLHRMRLRLGVAVMANLSFGVSLLLAHAWIAADFGTATASLALIAVQPRAETWTVGLILTASFVAFATSHAAFALAIWRDAERVRPPAVGGG